MNNIYYKTTMSCKVKCLFTLEKVNDEWVCEGDNFNIPICKLYHPYRNYMVDGGLWNYITETIKVKFWKFCTLWLSSKGLDEGYGILIRSTSTGESYFFQYRKEDFKRFMKFRKNGYK